MWRIILNHVLGSEAESGVPFSIRPNPGSKISNFRDWMCVTCFNVKPGVLKTIPGFFSRLDVYNSDLRKKI